MVGNICFGDGDFTEIIIDGRVVVSILNGEGCFYPPALDTPTVRRRITEIRNLCETLAPAGMSPSWFPGIEFGFEGEMPQCVFHWEGRSGERTYTAYPYFIYRGVTASRVKEIPAGDVVVIDNEDLGPEVLGPFDVVVTLHENREWVNGVYDDPYDEQTHRLRGLVNQVRQLERELRG